MRESKIETNGRYVRFKEPIRADDTLEVVNNAIERIKENGTKETEVTLTFSELQTIRRLLITDGIQMDLMFHNVKEGIDYRKSQRKFDEVDKN